MPLISSHFRLGFPCWHVGRASPKHPGDQPIVLRYTSSNSTAANLPLIRWLRLHGAHNDTIAAHVYQGSGSSPQPSRLTAFSQLPCVSTTTTKSQQPKGGCSLLTEHSHRCPESREGGLERYASQGGFWHRQRSSYNNPGTFPPLLQWYVPGSHIARTLWSVTGLR